MDNTEWENEDDEDWGSETEDKWDVVINPANEFDCDDQSHKYPYRCLSLEEVYNLQSEAIKEFAELIASPKPYDESLLLLLQYKWNKNDAFQAFTDNGDKVKIEAGIISNLPAPVEDSISPEVECQMCLEDFRPEEMHAVDCKHRFCIDCWERYLQEASKSRSICIRCPLRNCHFGLTSARLSSLPLSPQTTKFFERRTKKFHLENFIKCTDGLMVCMGKDCNKSLQIFDNSIKEVKCDCGHRFCPSCKKDVHRPCPCPIADKWVEKNNSESENLQWIIAKTKRCPKCRAPIEKTQGCNHMTCRNTECSHEFCWLCLGPWSEHGSATGGFYKCNIYETKKKNGDLDESDKARGDAENELERYTFYFERYENHSKAIDSLVQTRESTEIRMSKLMSEYQWTPDQTNFLREAAQSVIASRQLLMWTYPVGYFMDEDFHLRELFHQYQKDLEMYTEHLHELTLQDLETFTEPGKKEEVINHQRQVAKYTKNLLTGIETEINPKAFGAQMDIQ